MHGSKYQFQSQSTFEITCVISRIHDWQLVEKIKIALGSVMGVAAAYIVMRYIEMPIQPAIIIALWILSETAFIWLLLKMIFGKEVIGMGSEEKDDFSFAAENNEIVWSAKMEDGSEQKFVLYKDGCLITKEQRGSDIFYVFSGKVAPSLASILKRQFLHSEKELCYVISKITMYVCADEIESTELLELLENRCRETQKEWSRTE